MHLRSLLATSALACLAFGSTIPPKLTPRDRSLLPRLVIYAQTHHNSFRDNEPVSLTPLIDNPGVSHVIISAFHINAPSNLTLNDDPPDHVKFDQLWKDKEKLQKNGIKVMAMFGGAAPGTYKWLTGDSFNESYFHLRKVIHQHSFDGIDLDIEEFMELADVRHLIHMLKGDFGKDFTVTLAPVYDAMVSRAVNNPTASNPNNWGSDNQVVPIQALTQIPRQVPPQEPVGTPDCSKHCCGPPSYKGDNNQIKPPSRHVKRNPSGFSYSKLRESAEGKMVDWYNVQVYGFWGAISDAGIFERIFESGWEPRHIVMGTLTHQSHGQGYVDIRRFGNEVARITKKYTDFGGIMGWELYQEDGNHYAWAALMDCLLHGNSLPTCNQSPVQTATNPQTATSTQPPVIEPTSSEPQPPVIKPNPTEPPTTASPGCTINIPTVIILEPSTGSQGPVVKQTSIAPQRIDEWGCTVNAPTIYITMPSTRNPPTAVIIKRSTSTSITPVDTPQPETPDRPDYTYHHRPDALCDPVYQGGSTGKVGGGDPNAKPANQPNQNPVSPGVWGSTQPKDTSGEMYSGGSRIWGSTPPKDPNNVDTSQGLSGAWGDQSNSNPKVITVSRAATNPTGNGRGLRRRNPHLNRRQVGRKAPPEPSETTKPTPAGPKTTTGNAVAPPKLEKPSARLGKLDHIGTPPPKDVEIPKWARLQAPVARCGGSHASRKRQLVVPFITPEPNSTESDEDKPRPPSSGHSGWPGMDDPPHGLPPVKSEPWDEAKPEHGIDSRDVPGDDVPGVEVDDDQVQDGEGVMARG